MLGDAQHLAARGGVDAGRVGGGDGPFGDDVVMADGRGRRHREQRHVARPAGRGLGVAGVQAAMAGAPRLREIRMKGEAAQPALRADQVECGSAHLRQVEEQPGCTRGDADLPELAAGVAGEQALRPVARMEQIVQAGQRALGAAGRHGAELAHLDGEPAPGDPGPDRVRRHYDRGIGRPGCSGERPGHGQPTHGRLDEASARPAPLVARGMGSVRQDDASDAGDEADRNLAAGPPLLPSLLALG